MASVKNNHIDRRLSTKSCSTQSDHDAAEYKQPVNFLSDNNHREQFDNEINRSDHKRESQSSKSDQTTKQMHLVSILDRRVIDKSTLKQLKCKAIVVTAEDRRKLAEDLMNDREKLENESAARKKYLQSYDVLRTKGKQLARVSNT